MTLLMKNLSEVSVSKTSQESKHLRKNDEKIESNAAQNQSKEDDSPTNSEKFANISNENTNSNQIGNNLLKESNSLEKTCVLQAEACPEHEKVDDSYENLTEEEAYKKYKYNNSKYDKALEMFTNGFKANISQINFDKALKLAKSIVDQIISEFSSSFPKEVRTKSHNLKENVKLCNEIYNEHIDCADFVKMTIEQMQSEDLKCKDSEYIKNSILASQLAKSAAETDIFKCSKCQKNKCTYYQLQTRSCDEPMTTFVTCTVCGHVWKF